MQVAVTGATGFLGRNLTPALIASGHQVRLLSRSPDQPSTRPSGTRAFALPSAPDGVARAVEDCDAIIHLVAVGVSPKRASRGVYERINVEGVRTVLRGANLAGVPHVILAGTAAEYGRSLDSHCPVPPSTELLPVSDYAVSKARGFIAALRLAQEIDVGVSYLRIFNAYGPHQEPAALWPSLGRAALGGHDLKLSRGTQVRDFIPASDVVSHFLRELERGPSPGAVEVSNCGTGVGTSVREFAEHWWARWGATGSLLFGALPSRGWDPTCCVAQVGTRWEATSLTASSPLPPYSIE